MTAPAAGGRRKRAAGAPEEAQVEGLTHEGEGVVHGGKTAFVAGALPGERIRFHRTRRHRQHDDAELIEVLQASPARAAPRCPHFGVCGGCVLQHLSPAAQLAAKEGELREALARVARVEPVRWLSALAGPHWGYRRRARLGAKFVRKKGTVVVGFRERVAQLTLLCCELCCRREMLQHAAAAHTEVRAAWHDARRRGLQHFEELGVIVLAVAPRALKADTLPGQRPGDEGGLAAMHHPLAVVREPCDLRLLEGQGRARASPCWLGRAQAPPSCQARRNSAKCGSLEELRQVRTRSSSSSY